MKKSIFTVLASLLFLSSAAYAGKDRGGGVVFVCKGKVYLADSYDLRESKLFKELKRMGLNNSEETLKLAINAVRQEDAELAHALESTDQKLYEKSVDFLPLLGDDGIDPKKHKGCEKRQLAIQFFATGEIEVVTSLRDQLSHFDSLLFDLHERGLRVDWERNPSTNIAEVRSQVANWAQNIGNEQLAACGLQSRNAMIEFWVSKKDEFSKFMLGAAQGEFPFGKKSIFDKHRSEFNSGVTRRIARAYYIIRTGDASGALHRTLDDVARKACGGSVKHAYADAASRYMMADFGTFLSYLVIEPSDKNHFRRDVSIDRTVEEKIERGVSPSMMDLGDSLYDTARCAQDRVHLNVCQNNAQLNEWNLHGWGYFFREETLYYKKGLHW